MMRTWFRAGALSAILVGLAVPASAQVVQSVSFGGGIFFPRAFDARTAGDVLVADLTQPEVSPGVTASLDFRIQDFRSAQFVGEWHIAFAPHLEVGIGSGYQNRVVHSRYRDLVNGHGTDTQADDTEITQDLRLRVIPITGVLRVLGGRVGHFQPYAGAGVTALVFHYSEVGDFVDTSDLSVFNDSFVATGTAFGPVILGGFRAPLGGDVYALNVEGRYQWASGNTGGISAGFLGDKIDLSGGSLLFTFLIRY
jgi:hypothetical protein